MFWEPKSHMAEIDKKFQFFFFGKRTKQNVGMDKVCFEDQQWIPLSLGNTAALGYLLLEGGGMGQSKKFHLSLLPTSEYIFDLFNYTFLIM